MSRYPARFLARDPQWALPTQRLLAASRVAPFIAANEHLDPDVVSTLAATMTDLNEISRLVEAQHGSLDALPGLVARAREVEATHGRDLATTMDTTVEGSRFDRALARALSRARDAKAALAQVPAMPESAQKDLATALVALGADRLANLARMGVSDRVVWLSTVAADDIADDDVWHLVHQRPSPWPGPPRVVEVAAALLTRPALWHRSSPVRAVREGQELLVFAKRSTTRILQAATPREERLARELALAALDGPKVGPASWSLTPWKIAHLVALGGWSDADLARMRGKLDVHAEGAERADAAVAYRYGPELGLGRTQPEDCLTTWEHARDFWASGATPQDGPADADTLVQDVTLRHAHAAGTWLQSALADPNPATEAGYWQVALSLAGTFTGTLGELAEVARQVAHPAG